MFVTCYFMLYWLVPFMDLFIGCFHHVIFTRVFIGSLYSYIGPSCKFSLFLMWLLYSTNSTLEMVYDLVFIINNFHMVTKSKNFVTSYVHWRISPHDWWRTVRLVIVFYYFPVLLARKGLFFGSRERDGILCFFVNLRKILIFFRRISLGLKVRLSFFSDSWDIIGFRILKFSIFCILCVLEFKYFLTIIDDWRIRTEFLQLHTKP